MQKLNKKLEQIKQDKRLGLMTHVVVGYPSLEDTIKLVKLMEKTGVDIVELQIPFSDPLADGPTIMMACEDALKKGVRVRDAFIIAKQLSKAVEVPLLFMAYYNTVFIYGVKEFCRDAKEAGIEGLIIPDMPLEEEDEEHFIEICKAYSLANIRVVSPSATEERLKKNAKVATGFVYATARQGITGAKDALDPSVVVFLKQVQKHFAIPVAVGFGISKKEHLQVVSNYANVAIVGSALIDVINKAGKHYAKPVSTFLERMIH
jgi:tryptophan synthase alpha chain